MTAVHCVTTDDDDDDNDFSFIIDPYPQGICGLGADREPRSLITTEKKSLHARRALCAYLEHPSQYPDADNKREMGS